MNRLLKISNLDNINPSNMNGNEKIELSKIEQEQYKTKQTSLSRFGRWITETLNFNNLITENKNIIGAINETVGGDDARIYPGAAAHNSVYRGKYLGPAPTTEQYEAIYNGTFNDLYIGDYWAENETDISVPRWRIAGFNYYQNMGIGSSDLPSGVQTNHAIIIPDLSLTDYRITKRNEGGDLTSVFGGYKYSFMRGYRQVYENKYIDLNTMTIRLNHIPAHISYIGPNNSLINMIDKNDIDEPSAQTVATSNVGYFFDSFGEDPDNPGQGIVHLTGNFYDIHTTNEFNPTSYPNSLKPQFSIGNYVYVYYQYYDGDNLTTPYGIAKKFIYDTFGEEHIMEHPEFMLVNKFQPDASFNQYELVWDFEYTKGKIEIPTMQQMFGSSIGCYSEYPLYEYDTQMTHPISQYYVNNNIFFPSPIGDRCLVRKPKTYSGFFDYSHGAMYQLPLFLYDPNLLHPSVRGEVGENKFCAGYYLRNRWGVMQLTQPGSPNDFNQGGYFHSVCHSYGITYFNSYGPVKGPYYEHNDVTYSGFRPIFCISKVSDPNSPPQTI